MTHMSGELRMTIAGSDQYVLPFLNGGVFRMSTKKWPNWYIHMKDNADVKGNQGHPGEQGEFKFTLQGSGYYLISSKKWPNRYLYMSMSPQGSVNGWERDPGPQGYWRITPRDDGSILLYITQSVGGLVYVHAELVWWRYSRI